MQKNLTSESGLFTPRVLLVFSLCSVAVLLAMLSFAATPPSGTISTSGPTNTWAGPPTGGASANESTCVDGVNCDVYTLDVTGTPADWATKLISVRIAWTVPANDHDLYIHYDSNNNGVLDSTDPVVATGANGGAPGTQETAIIDPNSTGTGR